MKVLFHKGCYDGYGAAYAAWKYFGNDVEYIPMSYGETLPEVKTGERVYMLDWTPPPDELDVWFDRYQPEVVIIDHHATAIKEYGDGKDWKLSGRNLKLELSQNHSGAVMAWNYFHLGTPIPDVLLYVEDRDMWWHKMPDTKAVNEAIRMTPFEFEAWDRLMVTPITELAQKGLQLLDYKDNLIKAIAEFSYETVFFVKKRYYKVRAVNTSYPLTSELLHLLLDKHPEVELAVAYRYVPDIRKWAYSLRARDEDPVDVSEIAQEFGGGGHPKAAGFEGGLMFAYGTSAGKVV